MFEGSTLRAGAGFVVNGYVIFIFAGILIFNCGRGAFFTCVGA